MLSFLQDPTFFVFLSFLVFVYIGYTRLKRLVRTFLDRQVETIAKEIDQAAEEKERALQQLTRVNRTMNELPAAISKVWEEQIVDFAKLQERAESELQAEEQRQEQQLEATKDQVVRREYDQILSQLSKKFYADIQQATTEQRERLFEQSLDLLASLPEGACA